MNNAQQTARVGLFFILGLALIWVTFETLSGGKVFKDKGYTLIAGFESLRELKPGDEVRMAGVKIGEVQKTQLAGRRAEAILRIDSNVHIKSDATATIAMQGLIGSNTLSIDLGSPGAPDLPPGAEIKTRTTPDLNTVMSQIGDLGQKLEGALGGIGTALNGDGTKPGLMQKIDRLVTDNHDNVTATVANLREVTDKINKGEGTLGKIVNDPQLYNDLTATVTDIKASAAEAKNFMANAQAIVDQVKAGQGAIGALVFDQKAGDDMKVSIANLRAVSDKLAKGEGTLGKLISDDSMLRDAQAIMKKADRALDGLDDSGPITAVGVVARGLF
ncbi:MAG TPA: MlaD family protein [Opitutaceae bacterium]|nr:MlaD family protein [Opitutaceae bacterium]